MTQRADLVIIGAGIIGLATARSLLHAHPRLRITIVDKEGRVGAHQTGRNSGVIHAGVYYTPGSRKAVLCRAGRSELERYAEEHGLPFERCGKLIVASDASELGALESLNQRARGNGVAGIELVGPERMREIEPHVVGVQGLWCPETAIIDFSVVAQAIVTELAELGATITLGCEVLSIRNSAGGMTLETSVGPIEAVDVIACAGLQADRVARMTGTSGPMIVPFRGDYHLLAPRAAGYIRGLVYPVPDPRFPFLGVHFTRRIDGEVWAGPNAVLAFAREGYRRLDVNVRDLAGVLAYRGFLRVASRFTVTGAAEMWRDFSRRAFLGALRRFVPELTLDDLLPAPSGVRAQAIDIMGNMVDDFAIGGSGHVLHVQNAPSPAATASFAIGDWIARVAGERFDLAA